MAHVIHRMPSSKTRRAILEIRTKPCIRASSNTWYTSVSLICNDWVRSPNYTLCVEITILMLSNTPSHMVWLDQRSTPSLPERSRHWTEGSCREMTLHCCVAKAIVGQRNHTSYGWSSAGVARDIVSILGTCSEAQRSSSAAMRSILTWVFPAPVSIYTQLLVGSFQC